MSYYRRYIDYRLNNNSDEGALSWYGRFDELINSDNRGALRRYRRLIIY